MQLLPYAGDRIYWPDSIVESKHGVVSGIGANAIQPAKAAELHVRDVRTCAPLQRAARRLRGWEFLGHARQRLPPAKSQRRTSPRTTDESCRNGAARLGMSRLPAFESSLPQAL